MTNAEVWWKIGRDIENGQWAQMGLCKELELNLDNNLLYEEQYWDMLDEVRQHMLTSNKKHGYMFPSGTHQMERAMAAYWLALEAEDDNTTR